MREPELASADPDAERTAVMVIRVWMEASDPSDQGLRARITWRPDATGSEEMVVAAGSVEEISASVARLLVSFRDDDAGAPVVPPA